MPLEPKKPIEELLEASAKARRAQFGSDPKMPNPMRARLHDEIARLARQDEPATRWPWLRLWWPRFIIGTAAAAFVIGAPLMWWRKQQPAGESLRLARNQPAVAAETNRLEVQSLPAPAAKSAAGAIARGSPETKSVDLVQTAPENSSDLKKFAEVAIAPPASAAFAPNKKTEATNRKQQFSQRLARQAFRTDAEAKEAANVLNTFQIEQEGDQIRVVDADGSTYTGKIEPLSKDKLEGNRAAAKPGAEAESARNQFYFRATGYNGSLRKSLIFEGNYIAIPSSQPKARDPARAKSQEPPSARIVGTAKVNGDSPVSVDAISVPQDH
jgi:hypothetical protein